MACVFWDLGWKGRGRSGGQADAECVGREAVAVSLLGVDLDEKVEEHGPKPLEVHGFVGSIVAIVATVIFHVWSYIPEPWLHCLGITYYPSRYWGLAVPDYVMAMVVSALGFYIGKNFMETPSPTSFNSVFDDYSREEVSNVGNSVNGEQPIEPISDMPISHVNTIMFG